MLSASGKVRINPMKLAYQGKAYKSPALWCKTPQILRLWLMAFVGGNMDRRLSREIHIPG
jgi:hypothetical protein